MLNFLSLSIIWIQYYYWPSGFVYFTMEYVLKLKALLVYENKQNRTI